MNRLEPKLSLPKLGCAEAELSLSDVSKRQDTVT
jgi:hypothetical protein